jgi:hypothetical protein
MLVKYVTMGRPWSWDGVTDAISILVGKRLSERTLRKPRRRWKDNIKLHFREMGYEYGKRLIIEYNGGRR